MAKINMANKSIKLFELNKRCKNGFIIQDEKHVSKEIPLSDGSYLTIVLRFKLDVSSNEGLWRVCADVIRTKNTHKYVICSTCDVKFPHKLKEKQTKSLVTATKVITPLWVRSMLTVNASVLLKLLPVEYIQVTV